MEGYTIYIVYFYTVYGIIYVQYDKPSEYNLTQTEQLLFLDFSPAPLVGHPGRYSYHHIIRFSFFKKSEFFNIMLKL